MAADETLDQIIEAYDRESAGADLARADLQRDEALAHFPLGNWPAMPLERYAVGLSDNDENFCRWMEFVATELGSIRGGSARKLIVYKHANKPGWHYDQNAYGDEQEAWEAVRGAFVKAFEYAGAGDWPAIDSLAELRSGPALLLKSLYLDFPDEIIPICSRAHIDHYLRKLGRPEAGNHSLGPTMANRALLAALREHPELAGWSTKEIERLLYASSWSPFKEERPAQMIKVAPGEGAVRWDECRDGGYICVGWEGIGDLRRFETFAEFLEAYEETSAEAHGSHRPTITRQSRALWCSGISPRVTLSSRTRGTAQVLAVGTVTQPYEYDDARAAYKHIVRVESGRELLEAHSATGVMARHDRARGR